jgi:hypothetical protein
LKESAYKVVEVFKTNVLKNGQSKKVLDLLLKNWPSSKINFDLSDCDKILRVEGDQIEIEKIVLLVNACGFTCELLN